jgi:hypothetical protein
LLHNRVTLNNYSHDYEITNTNMKCILVRFVLFLGAWSYSHTRLNMSPGPTQTNVHLRLRTCIYVYYMLSYKNMCDKMFSNISTYTNSIYILSTIVNTQQNTKKTMSCAACFLAMCVFLTQPPQNGNFWK